MEDVDLQAEALAMSEAERRSVVAQELLLSVVQAMAMHPYDADAGLFAVMVYREMVGICMWFLSRGVPRCASIKPPPLQHLSMEIVEMAKEFVSSGDLMRWREKMRLHTMSEAQKLTDRQRERQAGAAPLPPRRVGETTH